MTGPALEPIAPGAMPIRTLLVDDEPLARRGLRQLLAPHRDVVVVGECRDGREALAALESERPDLVFLDVEMPELDGFGVIREVGPDRMPITVFLTAYDEFALHAFEAQALDYLVKPLAERRFEAMLARVRRQLELTRLAQAAGAVGAVGATPVAAPDAPAPLPGYDDALVRLVVPTSAGELVFSLDEIDWIGADDYYAAVHARGRRHLLRESLTALESRLSPARFVRVHRAAIVNVDRVREVRTGGADGAWVVLGDGTRLPVSRRRREALARALHRAPSR